MNKGQGLATVLTHTGVQTDTHRHTLSWSAAASKYIWYSKYCMVFSNIYHYLLLVVH